MRAKHDQFSPSAAESIIRELKNERAPQPRHPLCITREAQVGSVHGIVEQLQPVLLASLACDARRRFSSTQRVVDEPHPETGNGDSKRFPHTPILARGWSKVIGSTSARGDD